TRGSDIPVVLLMTVAGTAAALVAQSDTRAVAARLLFVARTLSGIIATLLFAAATVIAFWPTGASVWLKGFAWASGVATALVAATWVSTLTRLRSGASEPSPWEQGRDVQYPPPPTTLFADAQKRSGMHKPAVIVASAEGSNREFPWTRDREKQLRDLLLSVCEDGPEQ